MELRFLKGNWEFGKFKLQYREDHPSPYISGDHLPGPWLDVPTVSEPKKEFCKCCGMPFPPKIDTAEGEIGIEAE